MARRKPAGQLLSPELSPEGLIPVDRVVSKDRRLDAGGRQPRLRTYPFVSPFVTNGYY